MSGSVQYREVYLPILSVVSKAVHFSRGARFFRASKFRPAAKLAADCVRARAGARQRAWRAVGLERHDDAQALEPARRERRAGGHLIARYVIDTANV